MKQVVLVLSNPAAQALLEALRYDNAADGEGEDMVCDIIDEIESQFKAQQEDKPKKKSRRKKDGK